MSLSRGGGLDMTEGDWEPARLFFEERKLRRADLGGAGDWTGWSDELDGVCCCLLCFLLVLTYAVRRTRNPSRRTLRFTSRISYVYLALRL